MTPRTDDHFDLVSIGEPMVEFNQTGEGDGRLFLRGFGGDSSNLAIAAARHGARVAYVSAVGDDANGHTLRALWENEGVDAASVGTDPQGFTGIYFVTHDARGHHFTFYRTGSAAARMTADDLPRERIARARIVHVSGISMAISPSACDACYAAIDVARASGARVSFDTNLRLRLWSVDRARAIMNDVIGRSDICLPSYDDMVAITGLDAADAIVDHCLRRGARLVALKLGERGAIVADANERHTIDPHPCTPVDATGAGDTFGGAFIARLVAGDTMREAAQYAAVAAALSTEGYGAVAPIPSAERVRFAMSRTRAAGDQNR